MANGPRAGLALDGGLLVFNGVLLQNEAGSWRNTAVQGVQVQMATVQVSSRRVGARVWDGVRQGLRGGRRRSVRAGADA